MVLKIGNRPIKLMKAHSKPDFNCRTVLSNSTYEYVELWLRNQKGDKYKEALFYWNQSRIFYNASLELPIDAKPLTSYYSIMNATKALLVIHGVKVIGIGHGVSSSRQDITGNVRKDKIIYGATGVLCDLSRILDEPDKKQEYTVYDLLYNLPCVHRTFTITNTDATELFIPISDVSFTLTNNADAAKREVYIRFRVDSIYDNYRMRNYLPNKVKYAVPPGDEVPYYRIKKQFKWNIHESMSDRLNALIKYHKYARKTFYYINGSQMLWYIKKKLPKNTHLVDRHSMTIIYGVMHWLSEQVRYSPNIFEKLMKSKQNWLIREFIDLGLPQFIDEISSEITGANIMCTGYRK